MFKIYKYYLISIVCLLLCGCAPIRDPLDPFEPFNRISFKVNKFADNAVIKPAALAYKFGMPKPLKIISKNFLQNLNEFRTITNQLVQGKMHQAATTTTRFIINSSLGLFGIFDIASGLGLEKYNEDFGQTLGALGYKNSSYLVLPILGLSTVRDTIGNFIDHLLFSPQSHMSYGKNLYTGLVAVTNRVELLPLSKLIDASSDEYTLAKSFYYQSRGFKINNGYKNTSEEDPFLKEPPE